MTRSICSSLLNCKVFNAIDMAMRFTEEYHQNRFRGYGGGVVSIFQQWKTNQITMDNVLKPSKAQFDGSGSYGNGAAMRVAPVALFSKSIDECIETARSSSILTHSNNHGCNGAILQALAVFIALNHDNKNDFNAQDFVTELKLEISKLENVQDENINSKTEDIDEYTRSESFTFTNQLDVISDLLKLNAQNTFEESVKNTINKLGHDISAMEAVPAAIYSFLHNTKRGFQETLYFAIALGGDTDTIASMACAIAGAFYGVKNIPQSWISSSESSAELADYGKRFYEFRKEEQKI